MGTRKRLPTNVTRFQRKRNGYQEKWAIPLHEVGRYKQASQLKDEKINNIFFTGDYLSCATVEGGLRSGRWVASKISNKKITF